MYIIIVGGNETGYLLCRELLDKGHEVLVIEQDQQRCQSLEKELGNILLCGNGCEVTTLTNAGAARAKMVIAVTGEDEDNLAACQIAKQKFNVPQIIARVNNPHNKDIFAKLGIEHTVDVTASILEHIKTLASISPLAHLWHLKERESELILIKVGNPADGKTLAELPTPPGFLASLLIRNGQECRIPSPDTTLKVCDQLVCLIPDSSEKTIQSIFAD